MRINAVWYPVLNWQAAKHFYGELLGLKENHCNDDAGWVAYGTSNGVPLFLVRNEKAGRDGGACVTLETSDLDTLLARLRDAGVRLGAEQKGPGVRTVTVFDPDGNAIEVSEPVN